MLNGFRHDKEYVASWAAPKTDNWTAMLPSLGLSYRRFGGGGEIRACLGNPICRGGLEFTAQQFAARLIASDGEKCKLRKERTAIAGADEELGLQKRLGKSMKKAKEEVENYSRRACRSMKLEFLLHTLHSECASEIYPEAVRRKSGKRNRKTRRGECGKLWDTSLEGKRIVPNGSENVARPSTDQTRKEILLVERLLLGPDDYAWTFTSGRRSWSERVMTMVWLNLVEEN